MKCSETRAVLRAKQIYKDTGKWPETVEVSREELEEFKQAVREAAAARAASGAPPPDLSASGPVEDCRFILRNDAAE